MTPPLPNDDRRSRKRQRTADHIAEVAFALFAQHGYGAVTMEQIAAAADVAKGTLYNHFPVKEALVRHRMHADLARALPALSTAFPPEASCADKLRAFFRATAAYSEQNREYLPYYIQYRLSGPWMQRSEGERSGIAQVFTLILAEGQAAGEIDPSHAPAVLGGMLQFLHMSTVLRWLASPDTDLFAAFEEMLGVFLHGCATGGRP